MKGLVQDKFSNWYLVESLLLGWGKDIRIIVEGKCACHRGRWRGVYGMKTGDFGGGL